MATQNRPLPDAESARAEASRTIEGIFDESYQETAFNPAVSSGGGSSSSTVIYLTQSGTNPPNALVVENGANLTLANTGYTDPGEYWLEFSGTPFAGKKVAVFITQEGLLGTVFFTANINGDSYISLGVVASGVPSNDFMNNTFIDIRIYP